MTVPVARSYPPASTSDTLNANPPFQSNPTIPDQLGLQRPWSPSGVTPQFMPQSQRPASQMFPPTPAPSMYGLGSAQNFSPGLGDALAANQPWDSRLYGNSPALSTTPSRQPISLHAPSPPYPDNQFVQAGYGNAGYRQPSLGPLTPQMSTHMAPSLPAQGLPGQVEQPLYRQSGDRTPEKFRSPHPPPGYASPMNNGKQIMPSPQPYTGHPNSYKPQPLQDSQLLQQDEQSHGNYPQSMHFNKGYMQDPSGPMLGRPQNSPHQGHALLGSPVSQIHETQPNHLSTPTNQASSAQAGAGLTFPMSTHVPQIQNPLRNPEVTLVLDGPNFYDEVNIPIQPTWWALFYHDAKGEANSLKMGPQPTLLTLNNAVFHQPVILAPRSRGWKYDSKFGNCQVTGPNLMIRMVNVRFLMGITHIIDDSESTGPTSPSRKRQAEESVQPAKKYKKTEHSVLPSMADQSMPTTPPSRKQTVDHPVSANTSQMDGAAENIVVQSNVLKSPVFYNDFVIPPKSEEWIFAYEENHEEENQEEENLEEKSRVKFGTGSSHMYLTDPVFYGAFKIPPRSQGWSIYAGNHKQDCIVVGPQRTSKYYEQPRCFLFGCFGTVPNVSEFLRHLDTAI